MEVRSATLAVEAFVVEHGDARFIATVRPESEITNEAAHVLLSVNYGGNEAYSESNSLDYGLTLEDAKALRKVLTAAIRHLEDAEDE